MWGYDVFRLIPSPCSFLTEDYTDCNPSGPIENVGGCESGVGLDNLVLETQSFVRSHQKLREGVGPLRL